jgi:hypothetical protein
MPWAWAESGAELAATTTTAMTNFAFMSNSPPDIAVLRTDAKDLVSPLWRQREANVAANQQNRSK